MRCRQCDASALRRLYTKDETPIWRCRVCRQVFSDRANDPQEAVQQYEKYYSERNTVVDPVTTQRYQELLRQLAVYRQTNRLLDIGCGFGFFLSTAQEQQWEVYGTEVSPSAKPYFVRLGLPPERLFIGDLAAAGFDSGSFDVAILVEVIEHVADPLALLRSAATLVRPGGVLYLTTPNFNSLSRYLLGASWRIIHPREHLYYFTVRSLGRMLESTGFEICSVRTTGLNYAEILDRCVRGKKSSGAAALQEARDTMEGSTTLRGVKRGVNAVLSFTKLGDTIKVFARRRGRGVEKTVHDSLRTREMSDACS